MKIRLKAGGMLVEHLPPGSEDGTAELEVADGATPADVLRQLGIAPEPNYLVSLNGEVVPASERDSRTLSADDRLSIMPPLKGG